MRRIAAALLLAVFLAACGQSDGGSQDAAAEPNSADVNFVQQMIPHHEQAVEMAEFVDDRTQRPQLVQLSQDIISSQSSEIDTMTAWLEEWGEEPAAGGMDHGGGHDDMTMPGMMTEEEMKGLMGLEGRAFDLTFTEMMIEHHEGAIEMAETELEEGSLPAVQDLADQIIEAQEAEIEQMQGWRHDWR